MLGLFLTTTVVYKSIALKNIQFDINPVLKNTQLHGAALAVMGEPE